MLTIIKQFLPYHCYKLTKVKPDILIVHCVGTKNPPKAFDEHKVAAHFLVGFPYGQARILQLIPQNVDQKYIYPVHQGAPSEWKGFAKKYGFKNRMALSVLDNSIGFELFNPTYALKHEDKDGNQTYNFELSGAYTDKESLKLFIRFIKVYQKRYKIQDENIVAHSDIAPYKLENGKIVVAKTDPGINFPWKKSGLGVWPIEHRIKKEPLIKDPIHIAQLLTLIGYELNRDNQVPKDQEHIALKLTVLAFARRFDPEHFEVIKHWDGRSTTLPDETLIRMENLAYKHYMPLVDRKK